MSDQPFDRAAILADIPAAISDGSLTISNCHKMGMTREQFVIASAKSPMATFDPSVGFNVDAILEDIPGAIDAGVLTQDNAHIIGLSRGGFVLIVADIQSGGGGGGGDFLPLAGGTMDAGAEIVFASDSLIRQNPDGFGLDTVCANNYIHRWENGTLYITDALPDQEIRVAQYKLTTPPDAFQDESLGYRVGSRYILDDGTAYLCTDATAGDAVWEEEGGGGHIHNPGVAYVQTNGHDNNGQVGNPAKPFLTANAAYTASKAANANVRASLHLGLGSFNFSNWDSGVEIFVSGAGPGSVLNLNRTGQAGNNGAAGTAANATGSYPDITITEATAGGFGTAGETIPSLSLTSDYSITVSGLARGGNGGVGGAGGNGVMYQNGEDEFSSPIYTSTYGGTGGAGGDGGECDVTIKNCIIADLTIGSGFPGSGGVGGDPGGFPGQFPEFAGTEGAYGGTPGTQVMVENCNANPGMQLTISGQSEIENSNLSNLQLYGSAEATFRSSTVQGTFQIHCQNCYAYNSSFNLAEFFGNGSLSMWQSQFYGGLTIWTQTVAGLVFEHCHFGGFINNGSTQPVYTMCIVNGYVSPLFTTWTGVANVVNGSFA